MKTQAPKIKLENGEFKIEGDFKFELSPSILTEDEYDIIKKITFGLNFDMPQSFNEDKALELLGEKLKQDFLSFVSQYGNLA